jgi:hypothetical protein
LANQLASFLFRELKLWLLMADRSATIHVNLMDVALHPCSVCARYIDEFAAVALHRSASTVFVLRDMPNFKRHVDVADLWHVQSATGKHMPSAKGRLFLWQRKRDSTARNFGDSYNQGR